MESKSGCPAGLNAFKVKHIFHWSDGGEGEGQREVEGWLSGKVTKVTKVSRFQDFIQLSASGRRLPRFQCFKILFSFLSLGEGYQGHQGFKVSRFYSAFCPWGEDRQGFKVQFKILFRFLPLGEGYQGFKVSRLYSDFCPCGARKRSYIHPIHCCL